MPRGRTITIDQELRVLDLYKKADLSIKEIMRRTGIKSEQTIYRILDANNIPRRPTVKSFSKFLISAEKDVAGVLIGQRNISLYVNEAVRFYESKKPKAQGLVTSGDKVILDACCGSRMSWFDKGNPHALFVDIRNEERPMRWAHLEGTPGSDSRFYKPSISRKEFQAGGV